jgi:hypothetical protein
MRRVLPLLLVMALVGCKPEAPDLDGPGPEDFLDQKAACEKHDGRWGQGGASGFFVCYQTTRDGGKSCDKGTECDGLCLARSRTCAPVKPLFGCQEVLTDGGVAATLCLD